MRNTHSRNFFLALACVTLVITGCSRAWDTTASSGQPRQPAPTLAPEPLAATVIGLPEADTGDIWGGFPAPTLASAIEIPPPMPVIPSPEGVINILALGSDTRPGFGGGRTDTIIIISLDTKRDTVKMISVPRDLYVYIPGWKVNRINTADHHGGAKLVAMTVLYNLGIEIHHWARLSFNGFIQGIDTLGGIDIDNPQTVVDECDERPVNYPTGSLHMDGYSALCYARVRKTSSDFARTTRQQAVIKAVFNKVLSIGGIAKVPELYGQFNDLIETDMKLGDLLPLVPLAASVARDSSRIEGYTIDLSLVSNWRVPSSGAAVLLPNRDALETGLLTMMTN